jgi:hypothetical protein
MIAAAQGETYVMLVRDVLARLLTGAVILLGVQGFAAAQTDPLLGHVPLERDRVSPNNPARNPPLQTEPGKSDYLLYNHLKQDDPHTPIIYMKIPEQYAGKSRKPVHGFGLHVVIWYPEMTGSLNPANSERQKCLGWCNGRISMLIENNIGLKTTPEVRAQILFENMEKEKASKSPAAAYTKMDSAYPGEDIFLENHLSGGDAGKKFMYFLRRSKDGRVIHYAECMPDDPSPGCLAFMELPAHPGVSIEYSFSLELMKTWSDVQDRITRTIELLFVTTFRP